MNRLNHLCIILCVLYLPQLCVAQDITEFFSEMENEENAEQLLVEISRYLVNPIMLQVAERDELLSLELSPELCSYIAQWQKNGGREKDFHPEIQPFITRQDRLTLALATTMDRRRDKMAFQQRLRYSPSADGWQVLHKIHFTRGRISSYLTFEKDPGESSYADHFSGAFVLNDLPGIQGLTVGHFHVSLGQSILLNQQGFRSSFSPSSLVYPPRIKLSPHFSTREYDFFQGIGIEGNQDRMKWMLFLSSRTLLGSFRDGEFIEESAGIHPPGSEFYEKNESVNGGAFQIVMEDITFHMGYLVEKVGSRYPVDLESGLYFHLWESNDLLFSVSGTLNRLSRYLMGYSLHTDRLKTAIQIRYFSPNAGTGFAQPFALTSDHGVNETGISLRCLLLPFKYVKLEYAMDLARPAIAESLLELFPRIEHKWQIRTEFKDLSLQGDYLSRTTHEIISDIWYIQNMEQTLNRYGIRVKKHFADNQANYQILIRGSKINTHYGTLIQQRISYNAVKALRLDMGFTIYAIPLYDLALVTYEPSVRGSFSFPLHNGDGWRCFITGQYSSGTSWKMEARLGYVAYIEPEGKNSQLDFSYQLSIVF